MNTFRGGAITIAQLSGYTRHQLEEEFREYFDLLRQVENNHPTWWSVRVHNSGGWHQRWLRFEQFSSDIRAVPRLRLQAAVALMSMLFDRYEAEHNVHNPPPGDEDHQVPAA